MTDQDRHRRWQENAAAQRARFADYTLDPDHTITLETAGERLRVVWKGEVIAESNDAVALFERKHDPVYYFPQSDVRMDLLQRTDLATHCPYKGDASYWTLRGAGGTAENAVWAYETPLDSVGGIKDRLAFYLDTMGKDYGLVLEKA